MAITTRQYEELMRAAGKKKRADQHEPQQKPGRKPRRQRKRKK